MKKFVLTSLALISLSSYAQSYMVLSNGVTLTLDKAGFVYDFNHFFLPYKIQVNGGQFLVSDEKLSTVDSQGFLYRKDLEVNEVKGKGLNYFINEDNHLYTLDEKGYFYKYDNKKSDFKKASGFGGNFFTVKTDEKKNLVDLYTINSQGNFFKVALPTLNPNSITTLGGTWFMTKNGVVHTVAKDGTVYSKEDIKVGPILRRGGNFLIDVKGKIFTVSEEGFFTLPVIPANLKTAAITKTGSNYMIDNEGRLFVVDTLGNINERVITDHNIRSTKIVSF